MSEWTIDLKRHVAKSADFWVTWDEHRWNDGFTLSSYNSGGRDPTRNRALLEEAVDEIAKARAQGRRKQDFGHEPE